MTEFEEYLRGTFEINNGIENDVDTLVRIHAPELLKLAKKELTKDAVIIEDELVMCYNNGEPTGLSPYKEWWETPEVQNKFKDGDKVKVIIIK